MTMKAFRTSFLSHFGIEQEETDLVNDSMVVAKTILPDEISGKDVITAICEINGCFGHISREGKFRYVYLDRGIQGLFPRNDLYPADDLYPIEPHTSNVGVNGGYISAKYEDFSAKSIEKLQIRKEEDDIGVIVGKDNAQNAYIIEDNFLVYGKSTEELRVIANNIFNKITGLIYRPYNATVRGNPCAEVGDAVRLVTRYELIESYVLQRTLKGIQALRDNFSAKGVETYGQKVNSLHRSIIELKGKSNVLTRTIEETQSTITDVENGLKTQITQTANSITSEVTRATSAESKLSTKITQNANSIMSEVTRATAEEGKLSTRIVQNADKISSKVSKGSVSSEISQESGQVKITAGRFIVESDYLDINKDGTSGEIVSKNSSGRYIKFNTGGLEGGYNGTAKCKIECSNSGLAFRGASMTFCMDNIYVGRSMNATKTNKAYTGDIAYVAPIDGDVSRLSAAVLHVWNGLVLDNATYS